MSRVALKQGHLIDCHVEHGRPVRLAVNLALLKKHGHRLVKMRGQTIAELRRTKAGFVDDLPPTGTDKRAR